MTKTLKIVLTTCLFAIPIGLVVGFSNSWSNKKPISCVGSSGVKPFVENLASKYMKDHKNVDITVEAGGSGFGIEQIAKGYANIGDASKDPYSAVRDGFREEWKKNKIKTVTIGWEAICMVYIPPKGLGLSTDQLNNLLTINDVIDGSTGDVANFMRIFSGIDEDISWTENNDLAKNSMWHFVNADMFDSLSMSQQQNVKALLQNTNIIPYVRSGGSLTSGTASSFVSGTHLSEFNPKDSNCLNSEQQKAFSDGNYGTAFNLQQTDEANSRAWDMFSKDNRPGSIVYLSSGFIDQNASLIKKKGYGMVTYQTNPYDRDKIDKQDGYNWFRPLNTLVSLNVGNNDEIDFIKYLINNAREVAGCENLSVSEQNQMFPNGGTIWYCDYDLATGAGGHTEWSSEWDANYHFAPIPDQNG